MFLEMFLSFFIGLVKGTFARNLYIVGFKDPGVL
jgi:hypothetical protein